MQTTDSSTIEVLPFADEQQDAVLREALAGLCKPAGAQKTLSPWLFYDEAGSALFEEITRLPEYYLTRTERAIFAEHATSLSSSLGSNVTVAELGAGSASKTGVLLREIAANQGGLLYQPIDISPSALDEAAVAMSDLSPGIRVEPQVANYITERYTIVRSAHDRVLALYIGSSIGNFSPNEAQDILRKLHSHLQPGDSLLLGMDLAPGPGKSVETLLAAYDDAAGVTAAFNKNVLVRLNRELDADFDVDAFAHRARWNAQASRIEMHLESQQSQTAHIAGRAITFAHGETIHTENSYKFTEAALHSLLQTTGFRVDRVLHDAARLFAVVLAAVI